jgi:hypothetical protein
MSSWHNLKYDLKIAPEDDNFNSSDIINYFARIQLDEASFMDWLTNDDEEEEENEDNAEEVEIEDFIF